MTKVEIFNSYDTIGKTLQKHITEIVTKALIKGLKRMVAA